MTSSRSSDWGSRRSLLRRRGQAWSAPMRRYLIRRLARTIFALWGISTIVFIVMRLSGDPAVLLLPQEANVEDVRRLRQELGLDDPLPVQYLRFLGHAATGQFGDSF